MNVDPYFDLSEKIALITGGSRGLGYQMAIAFAERGADIVVASRKLENCEEVAAEVRALGRRALALSVHAAKWDSIDQMMEAAYHEFGRIDILVNNAGHEPADAEPRGHRAVVRQRGGAQLQGPLPPGQPGGEAHVRQATAG